MAQVSAFGTAPMSAETGTFRTPLKAQQRPLVTSDPGGVMLVITDRAGTPTQMKAKA